MTTCSQQEKLFDWHDGRLSGQEGLFMKAHLQACGDCHTQLEEWQAMARLVLQPLKTQDSEAFVHNVMRQIRVVQAAEEIARPAWLARWTFPALALSMASFAGALLYVAQPALVPTDSYIQESVSAESLTTIPSADQILGSIVERP